MHRSRMLAALTATALTGALAGCGSDESPADKAAAAEGYPVTVTNCGHQVTLDAPPERVLLLKSAPVQYLADLGVMDRVIGRAGSYPRGYYDDATWAAIEKVPSLSDTLDPAGHLVISKEAVLAQRPDLVLGTTDTLNHETLAAVGIPVLEEPALCPQGTDDPGFNSVAEQFRTYGEVFGVPEKGEEQAAAALAEVEKIKSRVPADEQRTAAVLYPTVGGGTTYAYGTRSTAHPQLEAAGLTNVFADVDERVFEVTREELIGRNPDVLILLHSDESSRGVVEAITSLGGAQAITAVKNDAIITQLFNFTEPATPTAITGLGAIVDAAARK